MKAVIHKTGAIGEVLGIEKRDGIEYAYFENGLCKPVSEIGFLIPFEQYEEDNYDWASFRREAAKDVLPAVIEKKSSMCSFEEVVKEAVQFADELIKQLRP